MYARKPPLLHRVPHINKGVTCYQTLDPDSTAEEFYAQATRKTFPWQSLKWLVKPAEHQDKKVLNKSSSIDPEDKRFLLVVGFGLF